MAVFHTYQQDPSSNDIFDHGSRKRISYSIWFTVDPADLTVERIHKKRAVIYKTLTVFGMKRKHKYRFILFEYLGIVGFSMILGIVLGIYESKGLKIILEYFLPI